jgi:hypothetical protein
MALRLQPSREYLALLPTLEEVLCRGTPATIRRYAKYLGQKADDDAVLAYSIAFAKGRLGIDGQDGHRLWRELEEDDGELTRVLFLWQQSVVYDFWSKALTDPERSLRVLGD